MNAHWLAKGIGTKWNVRQNAVVKTVDNSHWNWINLSWVSWLLVIFKRFPPGSAAKGFPRKCGMHTDYLDYLIARPASQWWILGFLACQISKMFTIFALHMHVHKICHAKRWTESDLLRPAFGTASFSVPRQRVDKGAYSQFHIQTSFPKHFQRIGV